MSNQRTDTSAAPLLGGRYLLGEEVGRGGMAVVHRAHDRVLDRSVAVKLLHPHLASDPAFLERFRREARAAAALSHPNVVAVHDWGEHDAGAYLVLQLVEGVSLRDVLHRRSRLSPEETLAVLAPAAAGLGAAHAAGLVHRDIKPENLLIGRDGTVRVTDFGLARAAASSTATFGPDVLVGSPHYLAPEAVQERPLDGRADVYALGIVLFECLTGGPPHRGDTPFSTAMAHVERAVPAPSSVAGSPASPALDALVRAATERDVDARLEDAATFASHLRAAVADGSHGPSPALGGERTARAAMTSAAAEVEDHRTDHAADGSMPTPPLGTQQPGDAAPVVGHTVIVPVGESVTEVVGSQPPTTDPAPAGLRGADGPSVVQDGDGGPDATHTDDRGSDSRREPRRGRGRRRRRWPWVLLVVFGLLAGSAAGGYWLWDQVFAPVTPIPAVTGAPGSSAVEQLERAGFEVDVSDDVVHDLAVPTGHVLEQQPMGEARTGTSVSLVLSAGPRQVTVPELAGSTAAEAEDALSEAGLTMAREDRHDESVAEGLVIAAEPQPGTTLDETSEVVVTVSLGPRPLEVPEVVGVSLDDARSLAQELGLELEVTARTYADRPAGEVLSQDPEPGAVRFAGDLVEVVVSDGPEPIELPNVRGERVADAVATLEALGLDVEVERRGGFSAFFNPDRVYDQDPGPGSNRLPGQTVLLYAYEP